MISTVCANTKKMYHRYHKQAWASVLSGTEVSVSVMSVCIWSHCAWPVVDWMRAVGLCPLWCSVTARMGWSSPSSSANTPSEILRLLILHWAVNLHLCICSLSPQTNHVEESGTHGSDEAQLCMSKKKRQLKNVETFWTIFARMHPGI